ncbi:MAG: single-stranded DNA-binding protein [Flavisolibacter sp.]
MNRLTLIGNVGKEPEIKRLVDGICVARLSLATTEVYRLKDGSLRSETQWHRVILWRSLAELAGKYIRKGSLVLVEGKLCYRNYVTQDGTKNSVTEIIGDKMIMLDHRERADTRKGKSDLDLPF